jgi:6-phosphogluconolactonase
MASAPRVVVRPDPQSAAESAAQYLALATRDAIDARGVAHVAFSGGSTPNIMFSALVDEDLPWSSINVYQVDERVAPDGHPERNATHLRTYLLDKVPIPESNVHLMPVTDEDLVAAAARYGELLPRLDVIHLGLGDDGHTASWPPGDPVVEAPEPVVMVGPFHGLQRMTITPVVATRARRSLFLVTGADKHDALVALLVGDAGIPATRVPLADAVIYCDEPARGGPQP